MQLGEWGKVTLTPLARVDGKWTPAAPGTSKAQQWRARARVRDLDGVQRHVEKTGTTRTNAERALMRALRERITPAAADSELKPDTRVGEAARVWWALVATDGQRAPNTLRAYEGVLKNHLVGTKEQPLHLAHLALREVKVSHVERRLREVAADSGNGAVKMTRSVLRSVLDLAVKHDAIPHNPVRSAGPVAAPRDRTQPARNRSAKAFAAEQVEMVLSLAATDPKALRRDLGDLLAFMAGTGARIGEACALRWPALHLDAATADLGPVIVRVKGQGLHIQEDGKSATSRRTVHLSERLVSRLRARKARQPHNQWHVVFPSPGAGVLRDPSNTLHDVRALMDAAGFPWATSHTFRKTVATLLSEAGESDVKVSNQLGHARPSMTTDVYMDRRTAPVRAGEVL